MCCGIKISLHWNKKIKRNRSKVNWSMWTRCPHTFGHMDTCENFNWWRQESLIVWLCAAVGAQLHLSLVWNESDAVTASILKEQSDILLRRWRFSDSSSRAIVTVSLRRAITTADALTLHLNQRHHQAKLFTCPTRWSNPANLVTPPLNQDGEHCQH